MEIKNKIYGLVSRLAGEAGLDVCRIRLDDRSRRLFVAVDRPGGVTVEECAELNKKITSGLSGDYFLRVSITVSSPGLDAPLVTAEEFRRKISFTVNIEKVDGTKITGRIAKVENGNVFIEAPLEEKIPLSQIKVGRVVI
ncbi:MAG: hypothetical protein J7L54_06240 [Elusimicrobia bacterium]|nr:hypothetical protein [Elusimicrobiota bacterium]